MIRCYACDCAIADGWEIKSPDGWFYHTGCNPHRQDKNMDLTPDEARLIQEQRAAKAVESRPVESAAILQSTCYMLRELVKFGSEVDPKDQTWIELLVIIDKNWH